MDNVIFINVIIFLLILFFIIIRYRKNRKLLLIDFLLIFYALFFPIGLIRPYLGYNSLIDYDIFYNKELLEKSSCLVMIFLIFFLFGNIFGNSFFRNLRVKLNSDQLTNRNLKVLRKINLVTTCFTFLLMMFFIKSQGNLSEYLRNIESTRQTLSGQMGYYTVIYFNVLLSLYTTLSHRKFILISKIGLLISVLFFIIYGFRGPIISVGIITFFVLQKLNIFNVKFNFKNVIIASFLMYLFVFFQDIRNIDAGQEPFFVKLITRFSGYEPVMVVYDKVVLKDMFTANTFFTNFISFFELPIPRNLMDDKTPPISILFTEKLFYNIGHRSFSTGGISPTIVGSLVWNFHYFGLMGMFVFGVFSTYIEKKINIERNDLKTIALVSISLYLVLCIEYPENFLGVLWMMMIGNAILISIRKFVFIKNN